MLTGFLLPSNVPAGRGTGINFALLKDCFPAFGPPSGERPARVGQVASLQMPSARAYAYACSPTGTQAGFTIPV